MGPHPAVKYSQKLNGLRICLFFWNLRDLPSGYGHLRIQSEVRHVFGGYRHLGQPWLGRHWFSELVGLGWVRSPQMRCQWTRTHAWPSRSQRQAETWARPSSHSRCNPTHLRIGARVLPWASRWWLSLTSRKLVGRSPIMFKQNHIFWPWHTRELGLIPWIVMKKSGFSYQLWDIRDIWNSGCANVRGLRYEGRIQEWLPHDLMGIE